MRCPPPAAWYGNSGPRSGVKRETSRVAPCPHEGAAGPDLFREPGITIECRPQEQLPVAVDRDLLEGASKGILLPRDGAIVAESIVPRLQPGGAPSCA